MPRYAKYRELPQLVARVYYYGFSVKTLEAWGWGLKACRGPRGQTLGLSKIGDTCEGSGLVQTGIHCSSEGKRSGSQRDYAAIEECKY